MALDVDDLTLVIERRNRRAFPVRGVGFSVADNEIVGIVGESGSGKSLTALAIMGLLPAAVRVERGAAVIDGTDILRASNQALMRLRGKTVAMVFQNYRESLNPVFTVSQQLSDVIARRDGVRKRQARTRVVALLTLVGLNDPERVARAYPHELSGGMAQRVAIALAFACRPKLLIADEPGTGLDVIVRAEVMKAMRDSVLQEVGSAIVISHDIELVSRLCDRVVVIYDGEVMERGATARVLQEPLHPYARGLIEVNRIPKRGDPYPSIPGAIPDVFHQPSGCPFHPRCADRLEHCATVELEEHLVDRRSVRCHLYGGKASAGR
jgi:oligopeptide/dipeptide ABC transporter ATP-binding protein